jgi:exodeoxyribonuclease-3
MKIATWNVNSLKARKERLLAWLEQHAPDVVCLQETKLEDAAFPYDELTQAGYHAVAHGQKAYNGVAILSREPIDLVRAGMGDPADDPQTRLLAARVAGLHVLSVYVPNGGEPASDKFTYKLRWLERLLAHLDHEYGPNVPLVLCGDLNIAPEPRDVARPEEWEGSVLYRPEVRAAFAKLVAWGLVDCFRLHHPEGGFYSWWDYRQLSFPKGNGLRIDHILAAQSVATCCTAASIDREQRKGKLPSDHAPVLAELDRVALDSALKR